jgi:hypothetical protein
MNAIVNIEDPSGVINTLQARVKQLEAQLEQERANQPQRLASAVGDALKHFRLHGLILLDLGACDFKKVDVENRVLREAVDQAWPLANAPVAGEVKTAIRVAADNGMNRWL